MSAGEDDVICTVCLDSLKSNNNNNNPPSFIPPIISLSCCHTYHFNCIVSWFTKSCSFLCPICKFPDKILLENFLPEIKNSLHKEILKSSRKFLADEEYEKYYEDCIKQGRMLKTIEIQQMKNSCNGIGNDYSDDNYDNELSTSTNDISDDLCYDTINNNEPYSYYQNNSYSYQPYQYDRMIPYINPEIYSDIETDTEEENEMQMIQRNINQFLRSRNGFLLNEEEEGIERENLRDSESRNENEDEAMIYARSAMNYILDDEEENGNNPYGYNGRLSRHRHGRYIHNENFFNSGAERQQDMEDSQANLSRSIVYENIFLNNTNTPSLFHKYRFYIISFVLFIIGYFTFL